MDYRDIIRGVREDRDDTQARIGEVLHKSRQGYSHIESGRAELKIDDLIKLCKFYNLSADYLIGLTNTPRSCKGRHTSTGRAGGCVPSLFRIHSVLPQPSIVATSGAFNSTRRKATASVSNS